MSTDPMQVLGQFQCGSVTKGRGEIVGLASGHRELEQVMVPLACHVALKDTEGRTILPRITGNNFAPRSGNHGSGLGVFLLFFRLKCL